MNKWKIMLVLFLAFMLVGESALAWGRRRSRGGGRSFRKWSSGRSFRTGSKSSLGNVHLKHARKAGRQGVKYRSRSMALKRVNHFSKKPERRPEYIPNQIKRNRIVYPVVYYHNSYGYWYGPSSRRRFVPVESNQYAGTSSTGSALLGLIILLFFLAIIIFIVWSIVRASVERQRRKEKIIKAVDATSKAPSTKHPLLEKIYRAKSDSVVTLSDPITLSHYNARADYTVVDSVNYKHSTFNLFKLSLRNDGDGDEMEVFVKDVGGEFCLFAGILDHDGRNRTLQEQNWFHLDESEDSFARQFDAVFPAEGEQEEIRGSFVQFEFGAFYDVVCSKDTYEPVGVCEYQPQGFPANFDWQHAIVLWEGGWISCYYCREIHSRNIDVF